MKLITFIRLGFLLLFIPTIGLAAVCDGYSGLGYNMCNKFCVTLDCVNSGGNACDKAKSKFENATGETFLPCECPCAVNGASELESIFLPLAANESYFSCLGSVGVNSSIIIVNDLGERQRQMFARPNSTIGNFCRIEFPTTGEAPIHFSGLTDESLSECQQSIESFCAGQ